MVHQTHRFFHLLTYKNHKHHQTLSVAGPVKGLKADACTQCGECLAKCPQNIQIFDQLVEVAQTLG